MFDPFQARDRFESGSGRLGLYRLTRLEAMGLVRLAELPYSVRVLLEAVLRGCDGVAITPADVEHLAAWQPRVAARQEVPFRPARVLLQDFTGVPAVVDLAAMRSAIARLGGDPKRVNPLVPVDLVIDHSLQVDQFATADAAERNLAIEFQRNRERYEFLRWAQGALKNFRVIPPGIGIVHQVNLEYLAKGVLVGEDAAGRVALPDTLVGADSHTTMINALGVLGWGVGGIEAEAVMLGQPISLLAPEVVGVELVGELPAAATATDLALTLTQTLRAEGVVDKFVEYFGPATDAMPVADRAVLANMAPEYGATVGFFPTDHRTLDYLRQTGRGEAEVSLVERYAKEQMLFREQAAATPRYSKTLTLDLATVEPCLAGPRRPHDRVPLSQVKISFQQAFGAAAATALNPAAETASAPSLSRLRSVSELSSGSVVIAAITSCTNTSNPQLMLAAGLLAQRAIQRGLQRKPWVKTSLAPGSRVVVDYLARAGLDRPLAQLGFQVVGYGCATCIGNSGPLPDEINRAITDRHLVVAAVLSGNRNFEGRIHPLVRANYLASPPLVVAYALAGTVEIDLASEPLGHDAAGQPVFLRELWPTPEEIAAAAAMVSAEMFQSRYADMRATSPLWEQLPARSGDLYAWDPGSSYIQEPPFLLQMTATPAPIRPIRGARPLLALGDSVTTDHISPAGDIAADSPAGRYLQELGISPADFNSYGARRGNDRVMTRGTFANIRLRNLLVPGVEGGFTRHFPDGRQMSVFDAAMQYRAEGVPLVILAGREYGSGSSRDWAAKGTYLLGVRAVIAASFERIHRGNLVGMGVLPLELPSGQTWQSLGLRGEEVFDIPELGDTLQPRATLTVIATTPTGTTIQFAATARIDTPLELDYYRHGGILQAVVRKLLAPRRGP